MESEPELTEDTVKHSAETVINADQALYQEFYPRAENKGASTMFKVTVKSEPIHIQTQSLNSKAGLLTSLSLDN